MGSPGWTFLDEKPWFRRTGRMVPAGICEALGGGTTAVEAALTCAARVAAQRPSNTAKVAETRIFREFIKDMGSLLLVRS
jgi:hypothetical protein